MKFRYSKFTGEDLDGIDLEELLSKLSDLLLSSGFDNPYGLPYDDEDAGHSMQSLHDAIMEAILNGGMISDETLEMLLDELHQLLDRLRVDRVANSALQKVIDLFVDEMFNCVGRLLALEHFRDVLGQTILQS